MIIKKAQVQKIIGVEMNALTGETYNHILITITVKNINPKDFEQIKSGDIEIK